jgi:hypothetical protein
MPRSFSSPGLGLVYIRSWYQVSKEFDRLCNYPIFRGLGIFRAVHQDKSSRPQYICHGIFSSTSSRGVVEVNYMS